MEKIDTTELHFYPSELDPLAERGEVETLVEVEADQMLARWEDQQFIDQFLSSFGHNRNEDNY
jgi:hypothetical protein